ncbi:hypothetical protein [Actinomadura chokoriensis]|uniref:Uncharacterized protein n=1 Tax=Actinomadura chokoriensis TaxID=454156 RepID=A0ABV4QQP7_9ACTN
MRISDNPSDVPDEKPEPPAATPEVDESLVEEHPGAEPVEELAEFVPLDEVPDEEPETEPGGTPPPDDVFPAEDGEDDLTTNKLVMPTEAAEDEVIGGEPGVTREGAPSPVVVPAEPREEPLDAPEEPPGPPDAPTRTPPPVEDDPLTAQDTEDEGKPTPGDVKPADEETPEDAAGEEWAEEETPDDAPTVHVEQEPERELSIPQDVPAERVVPIESVIHQSLINEIAFQVDGLIGSSEALEATGFDFFVVLVKGRLDPHWVTVKLIKLTVTGLAAGAGMPFPHLVGELAGNLTRELLPTEDWKAATVSTIQLADIGLDARDGRLDSPISRAFVIEEAQNAGGRLTDPENPHPPMR